jgi:hypothetical protein
VQECKGKIGEYFEENGNSRFFPVTQEEFGFCEGIREMVDDIVRYELQDLT